MDQSEKEYIYQSAQRLLEHENAPKVFDDPYSDMTSEEKSKTILYLQEQQAKLLSKLDEMTASQDKMVAAQVTMSNTLAEASGKLSEANNQIAALLNTIQEKDKLIVALQEQIKLNNKQRFGATSQKGKSIKKEKPTHQQQKEAFDGSEESLKSYDDDNDAEESTIDDTSASNDESNTKQDEKEERIYRKGMKYKKMKADKSVEHKSDMSRLPKGAIFIKTVKEYAYEQIQFIKEHVYELICYRYKGVIYTEYLPKLKTKEEIAEDLKKGIEPDPKYMDRIPGTKAAADFLAALTYNRFVLDVPLYREIQRIHDLKMQMCKMSLTNWIYKGSMYFTHVVNCLKNKALCKDAIINCDETWCRVQRYNKYLKKYIWCLVNRQAKIVIYCYEDGSRGRDALLGIINDIELKAIQSDGYNVYMYLDKVMMDIEHICCLAHARAKFKYALEQSNDEDAKYILDRIAELYMLERLYVERNYSPEEIKQARNSAETINIIGMIRSKLDVLLAENHPPRGELMEKAVRYLNTYWTQLFAYRNDGRYTIDNSVAERFIRPLACERKNTLFFGSDKMAKASALYHTVISTCRMHGISAFEYLKMFFGEIVKGRNDYDNLLPMTIGLTPNNY